MLIVSADDYGRNRLATDNIVAAFACGSLNSASAMVFMEDSARAAELALQNGLEVGMHVNFTQRIAAPVKNPLYVSYHTLIVRFLTAHKFRFLIYHPALRKAFDYVFHAQLEEYERLFGAAPTHFDGHHHMHLCMNMMLGKLIPPGQVVRRNFTYAAGEKDWLNRAYRAFIDRILQKRYLTTDYMFSLAERLKIGRLQDDLELARMFDVELQTHPEQDAEYRWLRQHADLQEDYGILKGGFSSLRASRTRMGCSSGISTG